MPETPRRMGNQGEGKRGISRRLDIPRLVPPDLRALRGLCALCGEYITAIRLG